MLPAFWATSHGAGPRGAACALVSRPRPAVRLREDFLVRAYCERRMALGDNSPRAHLQVIVEGNFDASQVNGPAMKTWLAFWAASMHQPSLHRLQRINDHRLYSNLCCQFRRVLPLIQARSAARGLAALIDGLWLRGALSGDAFDTDQAQQIAYEYMDQQLAKQER